MKKLKRNTIQTKKEGITLISVVLLSTLIITAVLGIAQVLIRELSFSADTLNGERAYFAAESGVEQANLKLLKNPIYHGAIDTTLTRATSNTSINNLTEDFTIPLNAKTDEEAAGQQTIRLQISPDGDTEEILTIPHLAITSPSNPEKQNINWTIRCKNTVNEIVGTVSLQGNFDHSNDNFSDWKGVLDVSSENNNNYSAYNNGITTAELESVSSFWNTLPAIRDKNTCTLSLENLSDTDVDIRVFGAKIAPEVGTVTATGTAQNRFKTIQFKTYQSKVNQWINWGVLSD